MRELGPDETHLAWNAMHQLHPHLSSCEDFVTRVNGLQRAAGYRVVGSFGAGPVAAAVAGFRRDQNLAWGDHLYIDDLVTGEGARGQGHARRLLDWVAGETRSLGCTPQRPCPPS